MARKAASGTGAIRKKTVARGGKEYTYWEARYSAGRDPGTGKQIQRSITGKTQKEVAQKLKAATASIDQGTYIAPSKMTVGEWLDIWKHNYLGGVKPLTRDTYITQIDYHIVPALGAIKLETLNAPTIQEFYNSLSKPRGKNIALSPKTVKNVHGVLHEALQQAVCVGYIRFNPTDACVLPRAKKGEIKPLDETQSKAFLESIKGDQFEDLFIFTLFSGLREGEVMGLPWDCVDFNTGTVFVKQQLQQAKGDGGACYIAPLKNDRARTVTLAPWVISTLRAHRGRQNEQRLKAGPLWEDSGFVFTNDLGQHLARRTVIKHFKKAVAAIGRPDARFHDLRHSYAVASIRAGDDIKTVQGNLGHATAAFTLDVYGHVTDQMKKESAARMENYIKGVLNL